MIKFDNVTKFYKTKNGRNYVLRNVTIEFPHGRNIGILGRNGAGKSTLLRMMGGIEYPNSGRIISDVRMSWPLGLSSGFQGSLTGRENCKFVCRVFGTSESDISEKLNYIKNFAEIDNYFDMPVKTYSSGMRSRLAFAMSMAFDFECYLIDEITSVGDSSFKEKCRKGLKSIRSTANVVMVSHDMNSIRDYCDVGIILDGGELTVYDDISDAIKEYSKL